MGIFKKNMFLAEDRILCFELVAKAGDKWKLGYVKPAKGETDVPEGAAELISQRRRWLNGSFAASVYALVHFTRMFRSGHNVIRLFFFIIQALYNLFQLIFTWFAPANLWLTFTIIVDLLPKNGTFLFGTEEITHWVNLGAKWLYLAALALSFVLALGNRPKGEAPTYIACFIIFALLAYYLLVCAVILTVKAFSAINFTSAPTIQDKIHVLLTGTNGVLLAALVSTYGIYFISSFLYADPWHMFTSFPQYIGLAPSFTNILNVYAFCNLHDVSWGTKGADKADALPSVSSTKEKDGDAVVVDEIEKTHEDLDSQFKETVQRAVAPIPKVTTVEKPNVDDQNRTFRTRLVALWILSNAALVIAIENVNGFDTTAIEQADKQSAYFNAILWATAGLSFVRFCGFFLFWLKRNLTRCCRKT
ncbi:glycosyltransferase family 2 protein [Atractiella rhizophila]|nr:glycosyltransferase family 2 protein [Atractiella rhizophila]